MAQQASAAPTITQADASNSKVRVKIMREVANELRRLDGEIKALQEERRTIKNEKIKGTLDMKITDFNAAMRYVGLEGDARAAALDTLREVYEALSPGDQLNFLDAAERQH